MKKETVKGILKFIFVELILALFISILLAPTISNWFCKTKLKTVLVGTVRDEINIDSTIKDATIIIEKFGKGKTDINGNFVIDNIITEKPRNSFWGCQSCKEETELEIKILLPESDSVFTFQRKLDNDQIGDTISQTFKVRL